MVDQMVNIRDSHDWTRWISVSSPQRSLAGSKHRPSGQNPGDPRSFGIADQCLSGWWLGHPSEKYESQLG